MPLSEEEGVKKKEKNSDRSRRAAELVGKLGFPVVELGDGTERRSEREESFRLEERRLLGMR